MNKSSRLISLIIIALLAQNSFGQSAVFGKFVDSYAQKHNFSGTILIQRNSKISYAKSFGLANRQHRIPNKIETKYKVASITKSLTAVLILRLYEQGKIDLDKTIKTYLLDYAGEAGDKVTIHQLLNHTAGMANIDRSITSADAAIKNGIPLYQTPLTTDQLLTKCSNEKLVNTPGKVFDYNNADYIILGKIVERIHGKPYEQVLQENILLPLKMQNSGMLYQHTILDNLADTYFYRDDLKRLVNDLPVYIENWYAAGAMYSTAGDVLKFSNALFGLKLLKKETLERMFTSGLDEYGYGVWVYNDYEINGKKFKIIKRPGSIMGAQSMLFHVLEADTTIIILANTGTTGLDVFAAEIAKRMVSQ
jgi:CubicO group peptidase (beta-lactamase class C family)